MFNQMFIFFSIAQCLFLLLNLIQYDKTCNTLFFYDKDVQNLAPFMKTLANLCSFLPWTITIRILEYFFLF